MLESVADRLIRTLGIRHVAFFVADPALNGGMGGFRLEHAGNRHGSRTASLPSIRRSFAQEPGVIVYRASPADKKTIAHLLRKGGNILLSVHTEDGEERDRAKKILENGGAVDISYTGEASVPKERQPRVQ